MQYEWWSPTEPDWQPKDTLPALPEPDFDSIYKQHTRAVGKWYPVKLHRQMPNGWGS